MREWSPINVLPEVLMDVPDLVFAYTRDGRYLFVNGAAAEFLGVEPTSVIGYHWRELGFHEQVMTALSARIASVARSGEAELYRFKTSREKGSRTMDMSLTPIWSEEGNVLAVLAIARDLSEFFPATDLS